MIMSYYKAFYHLHFFNRGFLWRKEQIDYDSDRMFFANDHVEALKWALDSGISMGLVPVNTIGDIRVNLLRVTFGSERLDLGSMLEEALKKDNEHVLIRMFRLSMPPNSITPKDDYVQITISGSLKKAYEREVKRELKLLHH